MKRMLLLLLWLSIGITLKAETNVWVSPSGHDSSGDGTVSNPYATLDRALSGELGNSPDTLVIHVGEGSYYMKKLLDIRQNNTRPIFIRGDEVMPRVIGGNVVTGWELMDGGVYRAFIPESFSGLDFKQFYVNGRRAVLARTPNDGFFLPLEYTESGFGTSVRQSYPIGVGRVKCDSDTFDSIRNVLIKETSSPKVRFYHKWDNSYFQICCIEPDSSAFYVFGSGVKSWNKIDSESRFFFYDYPEALDSPGEWYFDRSAGYLYYMPLPGENMDEAECVIPVLEHWIKITGTEDSHISNIHFENISFNYSSYIIHAGTKGPEQAAASTPAAIELDYADNITFENCEMCHTGAYAIWIRAACSENAVRHCYISDLGAGGVKIGLQRCPSEGEYVTNSNIIDNNIITGAGYELPCGIGVGIFQSSDNTVVHNEISNLGYSGVSIGWVWGYSYSPSKRNVVEFNHIHHIGRGELSDMGAVYTLGISDGTRVNNNVIHDIVSYDYGGWGLYTDEGSTHVEMCNNLVYRCKCGSFHQHYGEENRIENNIFAYSSLFQLQFTRVEDHCSFIFNRNIILQDDGVTAQGPWNKAQIKFGKNLFWSEKQDYSLSGDTEEFNVFKTKTAPETKIADPLFVNPHEGDFHFRSLKAVKSIGFVPFDYTAAGVYGSQEWIQKAVLPQSVIDDFNRKALPRIKKM